MSGIQANTLVDFSVFSIYDPNDAAKRILAMPSSCKNLDSMISGILENKPKVLNEIFTNIKFKEWKDVILEEVYKAVIKALGDVPGIIYACRGTERVIGITALLQIGNRVMMTVRMQSLVLQLRKNCFTLRKE